MFLNRNRLSVHGGDRKSRNEFSSKFIPLIISRRRRLGEKEKIDQKEATNGEKERDIFEFYIRIPLDLSNKLNRLF